MKLKSNRLSRDTVPTALTGNQEWVKWSKQFQNRLIHIHKYAVWMLLGDKVVGHLKRRRSGRFAQTISYFLRADPCSSCRVIIKGKAVNLGDGEGMQVPCKLMISQWSRQICNSLTKRTGQPRATIADYRSWRTILITKVISCIVSAV